MAFVALFAIFAMIVLAISAGLLMLFMVVCEQGCDYSLDKNWFRISSKWILINILKIYCKLQNSKPVVLIDFRNRLYITVATPIEESTNLSSYSHFFSKVGPILLHPDGTVSTREYNLSYIYNWLPVDRNERTFMILLGARGFDF